MLNSLKQTGKNIGREINRAWENLSEGWRELLTRSSDALTHFTRHKDDCQITVGLPKEGGDSVKSIQAS